MSRNTSAQIKDVAERFHEALTTRNLDGLMSLYTEDAILESSAVLTIEGTSPGILHGKDEIRLHFEQFFRMVGKDFPEWYHFDPYFTSASEQGRDRLVCEYPSKGPAGEPSNLIDNVILQRSVLLHYIAMLCAAPTAVSAAA